MKKIKLLLFLGVCQLFLSNLVAAQPPGGRGRGGFNPEEMIAREKEFLFKKLDDLSEDQKMLLEGIYDEFQQSFNELIAEVRQSGSWSEMRPKMEKLREEKDGLIKDVLNEEQFQVYADMQEKRRKEMQERREQRQRERDGENGGDQ